jgi:hypothetical protein
LPPRFLLPPPPRGSPPGCLRARRRRRCPPTERKRELILLSFLFYFSCSLGMCEGICKGVDFSLFFLVPYLISCSSYFRLTDRLTGWGRGPRDHDHEGKGKRKVGRSSEAARSEARLHGCIVVRASLLKKKKRQLFGHELRFVTLLFSFAFGPDAHFPQAQDLRPFLRTSWLGPIPSISTRRALR